MGLLSLLLFLIIGQTDARTGDIIKIGENWQYDVKYKIALFWINVGTANVEVLDTENIRGYECLHLRLKLKVNDIAGIFKGFYIQIDSWATADSLSTIKWRQYEKSSSRAKIIDIDVFPESGRALFKTVSPETTFTTNTTVLPGSRDFLGLLFATRLLTREELGPGNMIFVNTLAENIHISYKLEVDMLDKKSLKVDEREFDCYRVEPAYQRSGLFNKPEKIVIWFDFTQGMIPQIEKGSAKLVLKLN